jgi:hypothetical protein
MGNMNRITMSDTAAKKENITMTNKLITTFSLLPEKLAENEYLEFENRSAPSDP